MWGRKNNTRAKERKTHTHVYEWVHPMNRKISLVTLVSLIFTYSLTSNEQIWWWDYVEEKKNCVDRWMNFFVYIQHSNWVTECKANDDEEEEEKGDSSSK